MSRGPRLTCLFVTVGASRRRPVPLRLGTLWANNTIYQDYTCLRTFLRWCGTQGLDTQHATAALYDRTARSVATSARTAECKPKMPGRWLTYQQAYCQLLSACDDTDTGLRAELVIRLGLAGMRRAEIANLTWRSLRPAPHELDRQGKQAPAGHCRQAPHRPTNQAPRPLPRRADAPRVS
jgi:hypothetical protein